jgi:hypothetical protein
MNNRQEQIGNTKPDGVGLPSEEFDLDWRVHTLIGYQPKVSDLRVDAIIRGMEAFDNIPAVKVYKIGDGDDLYQLTFLQKPTGGKDGGHHRAVASYILGQPLRCQVVGELPGITLPADRIPINIKDIEVADDNASVPLTYAQKKAEDKNYR